VIGALRAHIVSAPSRDTSRFCYAAYPTNFCAGIAYNSLGPVPHPPGEQRTAVRETPREIKLGLTDLRTA